MPNLIEVQKASYDQFLLVDKPEGGGPVTKADRKDRLALLGEAIERLSPSYREVIMLCRIEGLSAREVAERMERSENAVHLLLSRALKKLAQEMKS